MLSFFALALLALPYLNITIDAELRSDAALPCAPLELDLRFAADADTLSTLRHISFPHEELSIGLRDNEGRVLHEPKARPKWYGGVASDRWGTDFADPELQTHRVRVNE